MVRGDRIKRLRDQKGMTQEELAKVLGTRKQNIYKYEIGLITNIPSDKIEIMAQLFDVSPSYIMGWSDEINSSPNNHLTLSPPLSDHEIELVQAYRLQEESIQIAICKMIDVDYTVSESQAKETG